MCTRPQVHEVLSETRVTYSNGSALEAVLAYLQDTLSSMPEHEVRPLRLTSTPANIVCGTLLTAILASSVRRALESCARGHPWVWMFCRCIAIVSKLHMRSAPANHFIRIVSKYFRHRKYYFEKWRPPCLPRRFLWILPRASLKLWVCRPR